MRTGMPAISRPTPKSRNMRRSLDDGTLGTRSDNGVDAGVGPVQAVPSATRPPSSVSIHTSTWFPS